MFALEHSLLAQIKINTFAVTIELVVKSYSDYFCIKQLIIITRVYLITFLGKNFARVRGCGCIPSSYGSV